MDDARSPDGPLDEADARRAADTGNAAGLGLAPGDLPQEEAPPLTLPEQIAVTLARDIVNSRFAEGEKLSEAKLAERFHVSRGPIRDAIELLERNMFVYSRPRRSARVASMTRYSIRQVFDMRAMLSGLAARYATRNATPADMAEMRARLAILAGLHRRDPEGADAIYAQNYRLWLKLHEAARARNISFITASVSGAGIWQLALRDRLSAGDQTLSGRELIEDWEAMLTAIEARDEAEAERLANHISDIGWRMVEHVLPPDADGP
ncbi:MAG: hypothetical protein CML46_02375 [Rhodobacteraceae bacterium]|nr:hypothetical protein [Paracoccaceae bacterium]MBR25785.1 hypothetical protein [Paracoccaceae bacterium]